MENEEDYVRVVATSSGNNGGNKIKLWEEGGKREEERARADRFGPR